MLVWTENKTLGANTAESYFGSFAIRKVKNKYRVSTPLGSEIFKDFDDAEKYAEEVITGLEAVKEILKDQKYSE